MDGGRPDIHFVVRALVRCGVLCAAALLFAGKARADGAFPDSQSIITPVALPHEIALATNFGVVMSIDDGQTWTWTCEQAETSFATLYQMGAPPRNRLYAVSAVGLVFSDDGSCTWRMATVSAGSTVLDAFPDPSNQDRVMAIVAETGDAGSIFKVLESSDGGATLGTLRYTADSGDHFTGVEIARSAAATVYVTIASGTSFLPKLARSGDGGASWQVRDLSAALGAGTNSIRLIAIDPTNPQKVFLRVGGSSGERVAVTDDGGITIKTPLTFPGGIVSAFTRLPSGSLVVAGVVGVDQVAFRSTDGGATFQPLPTPPSVRALSARGGTLYAVADNLNDGFAIATSADEGMTWQPLMRYDQIQAIQTCVKAACQTDCLSRADLGQWSADVCAATPEPLPTTDGDVVAHVDAATDGPATDAATPPDAGDASAIPGPTGGGGCHCEASGAGGAGIWPAALGLALLAGRRRRRPR